MGFACMPSSESKGGYDPDPDIGIGDRDRDRDRIGEDSTWALNCRKSDWYDQICLVASNIGSTTH